MSADEKRLMREAIKLAQRAYGNTSPNPLVGAILFKKGKIIGRGWHHRAGLPHAEIEAIRDAERRGESVNGATLYVTLEPCSTHGRTPPCCDAIKRGGIKRVVVAAIDPNPHHAGRGLEILRKAGISVRAGVEEARAVALNESFNHWIVRRTPFVTVKAAMSFDGKIATASGESKWITSDISRSYAMKLRQGSDAIVAGINTILLDDPSLTVRAESGKITKALRRIILDPRAQIPLCAKVVSDEFRDFTTVIVTDQASKRSSDRLAKCVNVIVAPTKGKKIDLPWLLKMLGQQNVTSLLVEGGGETNGLFLEQRLAHRIAFFFAPKLIGGRDARKAVAGEGLTAALELAGVEWKRLGPDFLLTGRLQPSTIPAT